MPWRVLEGWYRGDPAEVPKYRDALEALEPALNAPSAFRAQALLLRGSIHHARGDWSTAEQSYQDGSALARAERACARL